MTQIETEMETAKMDPVQSLKALRLNKGWRQEDLAKKINVPVRTIRAWEQGATTPKPIAIAGIKDFIRRHK
jgi:DNA-binding transcriptional regulator YiaG